MTGALRAAPRARLAAVAALLAAAGCRHENPPTPVPVLHAIDLSTATLATAEGGEGAVFEVVLRSRPTAPVEVQVRSEDASEGLVLAPGYSLPAAARDVTFTPDDWDVPREVVIRPVDDDVVDGDVAYRVTLAVAYTDDPAYRSVPGASVAVTNADDDVAGIEVSAQALETREGGGPARFAFRLATRPAWSFYLTVTSGDPAEGLVRLAGSGGSCPDGAQQQLWTYLDASSWDLPREIEVCPVDDQYAEAPRSYAIAIRPAPGAGEYELVPEGIVTVTNASDDPAALVVTPVLPAAFPLVTAENGSAATFSVALASPPRGTVVVPVSSGDASEGLVSAGGSPAATVELTFTLANWWSPQLVTVTGQDDPVAGGDGSYEVAVGPPAGDPGWTSAPAISVPATNLDDDVPLVRIDPSGPFTTSETGETAAFSLSISPPRAAVIVRVASGAPGEGLVRGGAPAQESVDVSFGPSDWGPKRIEIVGQPDESLDGDVSYLVTVSVVSGDAGYLALAPLGVAVTNVDVLTGSLPLAAYDPALSVPACDRASYGCSSGSLLDGRGSLGPEPHQPNTVGSTCGDGGTGAYHVYGSLDALKIYMPDGSTLTEGGAPTIEATVWGAGSWERLDLWWASLDGGPPAWTLIGSYPAPSALGRQVIVVPAGYTLPAGTSQAIRGTWRYSGWVEPGGCTAGSYDDHDDLAFVVAPLPPPVPPPEPPPELPPPP